MGWNIADLFETVVAAVPEHCALSCAGRRLSYAALDDRVNRLASHLTGLGLGADDHIGLLLRNGTEYVEGMLAAFKIRAVPINVNYRYVMSELRDVLASADIQALIHEPDFDGVVGDLAPSLPLLRHTLAAGRAYEEALAAAPSMRPDGRDRSGDDLYILYTGGTTGAPKGVVWRHADILFAALGVTPDLVGARGEPDDERLRGRARSARRRTLPACPLMHGTAHWTALSTLLAGGEVVLSPDRGFDASQLLDLASAERVSFLVIVGDAFARPIAEAIAAEPRRWDLSGLSVILSGGAVLSPATKERLTALLPSTIVVDGYGASETGGQGSMVTAAGSTGGPPRFRVNAETAVLDEDLRPVAPGSGVVGRLARRGHVPLGYYRDEAATRATFPTIAGERWAVTNDLAELAVDGTIVLYGRGSGLINSGGEKVFAEEVEAVLKAHRAVADAVVVGIADERLGERVTAVVEATPGHEVDLATLQAHCRLTLAGYKVPRTLVVVDQMCRTEIGKPDYRWAVEAAQRAAVT